MTDLLPYEICADEDGSGPVLIAKGPWSTDCSLRLHVGDVQADLLDSEIEAAEVLAKHKFTRAAGAVAGVVMERYLAQVCADHKLSIGKKNPTIADFNEALKAASVTDLPQWRFIQHLADIRNLCDHSRSPEPSAEQVTDLLAGVKKVTKTVFY